MYECPYATNKLALQKKCNLESDVANYLQRLFTRCNLFATPKRVLHFFCNVILNAAYLQRSILRCIWFATSKKTLHYDLQRQF